MEVEALVRSISWWMDSYETSLEGLALIARGLAPPEGLKQAMGSIFWPRYKFRSLLQIASEQFGMQEQLQDLSILRKAAYLEKETEKLLGRVDASCRREALLQELTEEVDRYVDSIKWLLHKTSESAAEGEDIFDVADMTNAAPLISRDMIAALLDELGHASDILPFSERIAWADEVLRNRGRELLAPYIRHGYLELFRRTTFPPRDWWWDYLDESGQEGSDQVPAGGTR